MSLTKYAEVSQAERAVEVLDAFVVPANVGTKRLARLRRKAHRHEFDYSVRPGYIYVRSRAISSRCNDNFDEFPASEIKQAYRSFIGKPVFVNHHNSDHRRARGVIIDAALHEDTNPDGTEDTWAEVLMEVDAISFPVLAREVAAGNIARTSMGTDVAYSECTACGNKAATPVDYCQHIPKMKGMKIRRAAFDVNGKVAGTEEVLIAERCYGLHFFENSLLVEDPADPTAFVLGVDGEGISRAAARAVIDEAEAVVHKAAASASSNAPISREATLAKIAQIKPVDTPITRLASNRLTTVKDLVVGDLIWYGRGLGHSIDATVISRTDTSITIKGDARTGFTKTIDDDDLRSGSVTLSLRDDSAPDDYGVAASRRAVAALSVEAIQHTQYCDLLPSALENLRERGQSNLDSQDPAVQIEIEGYNEMGLSCACGTPDSWHSASRPVHAYGETKAPAKVDTLRAENCPVCGDDEAYNGDKCSVCGYMQPPDQFGDPDLNKARETDLRQEQGLDAQPVDGAVDPLQDGEPGALECDQCGEVFDGAEGGAATGAPAEDPTEGAAPFENPEVEDGKATEPADLDDEEDLSDDEIFADDDEDLDAKVDIEVPQKSPDSEKSQVSPGAEEDTEEDKDADPFVDDDLKDVPEAPADPAVGEARITSEPEGEQDTTLDGGEQQATGPVANGTCPVCGMGTLIPQATTVTTDGKEPKITEVGNDPTKKQVAQASSRVAQMSKESVDMNQPNPAQRKRSAITRAIAEQQGVIEGLTARLAAQDRNAALLRDAVAAMAVSGGFSAHPKFATIVRAAGLKVADADTNQGDSIGGTPDTTTEQAKQPDATDNVENLGAAPAAANTGVTPAGVTDVNNSDVVANPPVLDNLQSVTAPVAGTDAVVPAAGDAAGASTVTVGTPSNEAFDKPGDSGWTASKENERFVASMRLARLRINASIEQGEDLVIAQRIASSNVPLGEITAQVEALHAVASTQAAPAPRHLVPRAAQRAGGVQPTRQPSMQATATAAAPAETGGSEWMFGGDDLS